MPPAFSVSFRVTSETYHGFSGEFAITNTSSITGRWMLTATFGQTVSVSRATNATLCYGGASMVAIASQPLAGHQSIVVTFTASFSPRHVPPTLAPSPYGVYPQVGGCAPDDGEQGD